MSSRTERRIERVKTQVPMRQLLSHFGYHIRADGGDHEEQFQCDLHGDGRDNKPSARFYPDNTWYCFACGITRDTIATVRAKIDLDFMGAVEWLEQKFKFPVMPFEEDDDIAPRTVSQQVVDSIVTSQSFDEVKDQARKRLDRVTKERGIPLDSLLGFWETFDLIAYEQRKGLMSDWEAKKAMITLASDVLKSIKGVIENDENCSVHH